MQALNTLRAAKPCMEHRWGERIHLDLPVRLELAGELLGMGRLRNASISGAYVETDAGSSVLATVDVVVPMSRAMGGSQALAASVVRRDEGGLGLEWRDMACEAVVRMLRDLDAQAPLWRKDPVFG